ncbi:MAG: hypothetical protein H6654_17115 [Ardenticatenaceae bacterium]|nr:hypothetical protein [Anaerolineales bacterium]MCB8938407.1 hypothetical protein [Ardenticatenaceae bacterium]MCB8975283.1 hypothetical protein [Ardenticatenaceae bacterium]
MAQKFNYLFVSDFHLSEGQNPANGLIQRNEDFFQDVPFAQFIAHHVQLSRRETAVEFHNIPWKLVINGDIFDFLQVVTKPAEGKELLEAKGVRSYKELSANEREYGLGTSERETVWKLKRIANGHLVFFQALAWFLAHEGNELVLMKGNHDIELYWPEVQTEFRRVLSKMYVSWRETAVRGNDLSPLPMLPNMPDTLNLETLAKAVSFPANYLYEPGLFFVEHGCQYDPANHFTNFNDPRLPQAPKFIELPSGSFFVRYFFNKVEQIHPFADNIKPIMKYLNWVLKHSPSAMVRVLIDLLPRFVLAWLKMKWKQLKSWWWHARNQEAASAPGASTTSAQFENTLLEIQANIRRKMKRASRLSSVGTVSSLLFKGLAWLLILIGIRSFIENDFIGMVIFVILGGLSGFVGNILIRMLDKLLESPFLRWAAQDVAKAINEDKSLANVPYYIYGHDHAAVTHAIKRENSSKQPQWYVNTGAWIPVFKEEERLLREDVQLTFLRLVPGRAAFPEAPPELLQWSAEGNTPMPVRLFED